MYLFCLVFLALCHRGTAWCIFLEHHVGFASIYYFFIVCWTWYVVLCRESRLCHLSLKGVEFLICSFIFNFWQTAKLLEEPFEPISLSFIFCYIWFILMAFPLKTQLLGILTTSWKCSARFLHGGWTRILVFPTLHALWDLCSAFIPATAILC